MTKIHIWNDDKTIKSRYTTGNIYVSFCGLSDVDVGRIGHYCEGIPESQIRECEGLYCQTCLRLLRKKRGLKTNE